MYSSQAQSGSALFDDEFLKRLEGFRIVAQRLLSGQSIGSRRGKRLGSGVEFADYRQYCPGDDFRYLDWNVYARSGKLLLRLFQEDEDLSVHMIVDVSRSMRFGSPCKLEYAKKVAAALGYVALGNLDRVSIFAGADQIVATMAPTRGRGQIFSLLHFLDSLQAKGETNLAQVAKRFVAQKPRKGIVFVISDFFDPSGISHAVNELRYAKYETHVIQVVDKIDQSPPVHGDVNLVDEESGQALSMTITPKVLEKYRQKVQHLLAEIAEMCTHRNIPYHRVAVDTPFDEALLAILRKGNTLV